MNANIPTKKLLYLKISDEYRGIIITVAQYKEDNNGLCALDLLLLAVFGVLGIILYLAAGHAWWHDHAAVDPVVYWTRALQFFNSGMTWQGLGPNEYPPGALWFFALLASLSGTQSLEFFLSHLKVFNILLLGGHVLLARLCVSSRAAWLMLLLGVMVGPILLHRFELLVSLLVLVSWQYWGRGNFGWGAFWMGVATATKIYPLLLAPLLGMAAIREKGWKGAFKVVFFWMVGVAVPVGGLYLCGSTIGEMAKAFRFHLDKPFGVEGLLGSGVPILQWALGIPLRMAPRNGVHGFDVDLPAWAVLGLEWLWLPAVLLVMLAILLLPKSERCACAPALFVMFGWYFLLGKLTTPQYAWWALPFLALTPKDWVPARTWRSVMFLVVAALAASQVVYPVFYGELLKEFAGNHLSGRMFWINTIKNLLWLLALSVMTWHLGKRIVIFAQVKNGQAESSDEKPPAL